MSEGFGTDVQFMGNVFADSLLFNQPLFNLPCSVQSSIFRHSGNHSHSIQADTPRHLTGGCPASCSDWFVAEFCHNLSRWSSLLRNNRDSMFRLVDTFEALVPALRFFHHTISFRPMFLVRAQAFRLWPLALQKFPGTLDAALARCILVSGVP